MHLHHLPRHNIDPPLRLAFLSTMVRIGVNSTIFQVADPLLSAATSLLVRLTAEIVKYASASVATEIEIFNTPSKIKSISRKLANLEVVKTIKNPDKPSKISSFYITPLFEDTESKAFEAKTVDDFGNGEHPLIEGIAGQGKSIFMRQLCIEELKLGRRLPILIELRKIANGKTLEDFGIEYLRAVGFCRCDEIWKYLLESGFAVLLLDGYDEVQEEYRMQLIHDINMLSMSFDQLRIVITSRPETSIKGVSCLQTVKMRRLDHVKRDAIIKKICDRNTASKLIDKMSVNSNLSEIVDTPLFATLLCIVYRAEHRLPETVHEFYDMVFQTLLYRHDQQKEGYERPRKSGLGNHQFSAIFENFCIRTSLGHHLRLSQEKATEIMAISLEQEGSDPSLADKYFTDVTKITCLLVKDGTEYQFLHKSIQEYFSARYIKRLPEDRSRDFYTKILDSPSRITELRQTLYFLYEIDSYRSYKYFVLPSLLVAFPGERSSSNELPEPKCTGGLVIDILSEVSVVVGFGSRGVELGLDSIHIVPIALEKNPPRQAFLEHFDLLFPIIAAAAELLDERQKEASQSVLNPYEEAINSIFKDQKWSIESDLDLKYVSCSKAIEGMGLQDDVAKIVNATVPWKRFQARIVAIVNFLQRMDSTDLLDIV
jgi:hypothetical protein